MTEHADPTKVNRSFALDRDRWVQSYVERRTEAVRAKVVAAMAKRNGAA